MPRQNVALQTFNRGVISPKALARIDIEKVGLGAEIQTNWLPSEIGPMSLRPGWKYIGSTGSTYLVPFHRSQQTVALLEFQAGQLRIWENDALVARSASLGSITNGDFSNGTTGWFDESETNGNFVVAAGIAVITGSGFDEGRFRQQVSGAASIRIKVSIGPVHVRIGRTEGTADIYDAMLDAGEHSLVVGEAFWLEFANDLNRSVHIESVETEAVGPLVLPGFESIGSIRYAQSADVVFLVDDNEKPMKVERRNDGSWGFSEYRRVGGPFNLINSSSTTISASGISGDITLTASRPVFEDKHEQKLFRLDSETQYVHASVSGPNQWTDPIRTSGVGLARDFTFNISGTGTMNISLQLSIGAPGDWTDLGTFANGAGAFNNDDVELQGQIVYFRLGVQAINYTSGTKVLEITYDGGSISGIARITSVTSPTLAQAQVIQNMGSTSATTNWYEDAWADRYPSALELYDGRLFFFGKNRIWASVSDDYPNMDTETEGDSGPIDRTIGKGPVDKTIWAMGLQRLVIGTAGSEISLRSSSLDEPMTPTDFGSKPSSTQGSREVDAVGIDDDGIFVQRSGTKLYLLTIDGGDYQPFDLNLLQPEFCQPGVKRLMVQRQPNTRIHCVLEDGAVAVLLFNPAEELRTWFRVETDGLVEDVCVVPGDTEDQVYYVVNREGSRCLEKWTMDDAEQLADSHVVGVGPTISGLDHLEGREVVGWNGTDLGARTVVGGSVSFTGVTSEIVVGLGYRARYKSTKLAYAAGGGTALTMRKTVDSLGLILHRTHARGLKIGDSFEEMDDLSLTPDWSDVDDDHIYDEYDYDGSSFRGGWDTDQRLYLEANAPRPATVMAAIIGVKTDG